MPIYKSAETRAIVAMLERQSQAAWKAAERLCTEALEVEGARRGELLATGLRWTASMQSLDGAILAIAAIAETKSAPTG